jgi:hypothetical protein
MPNGPTISVMPLACPFCHAEPTTPVRVYRDDYDAWVGGTVMQNAMPYLTASERESLKTGMCDSCWDSM